MKKLMGIAITAAMLVPGPASAEILKNLKVGGQLDIAATSARNAMDFATRTDPTGAAPTQNDRIGSVISRLLVDAKWDLLDDVHANVTLRKNDRAWGGVGGVGQQAAGGSQNVNGVLGTGGALSNMFVDQSNIVVDKAVGHVDMTLGRQFYGDAGDLIINYGAKDNYGLIVTAIDAARFEAANDWMAFSGLAGKTGAGGFGPGTVDTNVRGFDLLWKSLPLKAHTYLWNQVTQSAGALGSGKNDNLWVYGVKLRGEAMGGWLNVDIAANGGEDRSTLATAVSVGGAGTHNPTPRANATGSNYTGKALLLDAGYNAELGGMGALTPWVNFGYGTGRSSNFETRNEGFRSIATDYRPGIMNRRFSQTALAAQDLGNEAINGGINTAGLNNRVVYGLGLNFTPAKWEKLTVGTQLWSFNTQRFTQTTANNGAANTTARGAKHLGVEYGITADWKHSENIKYGFGASIYQAGGAVKQAIANVPAAAGTIAAGWTANTGNNPAMMTFADLSVKF